MINPFEMVNRIQAEVFHDLLRYIKLIYDAKGSIEIIVRDSEDNLIESRQYASNQMDEQKVRHDTKPIFHLLTLEDDDCNTLDDIRQMFHVCALELNSISNLNEWYDYIEKD